MKNHVKTPQEIKQMIANFFDCTIDRITYLYHNDSEMKEAIELFLNDINSRRVQNGLEKVSF